MKKIIKTNLSLFLLIGLLMSTSPLTQVFAQNRSYQGFKLDLATGFVFPAGSTHFDKRVVFSAEPKYNVTDHFSLGLRMEVAPNTNLMGTDNVDIETVSSYIVTGEYLFEIHAKNFRPFFGVGAGMFNQTLISDEPDTTIKTNKPGVATRAGFERGYFRFAVEYNLTWFEGEKKVNYYGFKIGFFLWGNQKRK